MSKANRKHRNATIARKMPCHLRADAVIRKARTEEQTEEKQNQEGKPVEELINGFTGFAKKNTMSSASLPHKEEASTQESEGHLTFDPEKLAEIEPIDRRWSWLEIDLNAIRNNVRVSKNQIGYNCRLCAVVKADAYGHGAVRVAKTALNSGAE